MIDEYRHVHLKFYYRAYGKVFINHFQIYNIKKKILLTVQR